MQIIIRGRHVDTVNHILMAGIEGFSTHHSDIVGQAVFSSKGVTPLSLLAQTGVARHEIAIVVLFVIRGDEIGKVKLVDNALYSAAQL